MPDTDYRGLHNLKPARGSRKNPKRVGRGPGTGHGKTAGRGENGQMSRAGARRKIGFEGGQMPLHRRIPKRGFKNLFRKEYAVINLDRLARRYGAGEEVTPERLVGDGVIRSLGMGVKVLAQGEIAHALRVKAHRFSKQAAAKIQAAGGTVEVVR